jgi:hypothetical protein
MTLEEAIEHCEEVAYKNECKMTSDDGYTDASMKRCAEEHRQLAEWLKELKQLREQTGWIPVSDKVPEDNGYYLTTTMFCEVYCDHWTEVSFDRQETVIAWMPLPKPYRQ